MVDNIFGLEDEEIITRKEVTTNLFTSLIHQNSLYTHKAKIRWLKGGEVKTSFFHKAINISRKRNEIVGLNIEGVWLMKLMMSGGGGFILTLVNIRASDHYCLLIWCTERLQQRRTPC